MAQFNELSKREQEVVQHLLEGKSNKLIALSLGVSDRTVRWICMFPTAQLNST